MTPNTLARERIKARWRGVVVPVVTPFADDGSVDLTALRKNIEWLLSRGARPGNTILLVAGSGGDFTVMDVGERLDVIRAVAEVAGGRLPIIAGGQSVDIRDTIAICQLCEDLGVDAVQISAPYYYDGRPSDVVAWMAEVARQTAAGFCVYNNWYTGYDMPLDLVARLLELPNAVALKWSSPNMLTFFEGVRRFRSDVAVVDNTLLAVPGHLAGCHAFVSHFPNFYPEFCWRLYDLMEAGRYPEAQELYDEVMAPYQALVARVASATAGEAVFVRPAMAAAGLNGGRSRLPSRDAAITPEIREGFKRLLQQASVAVAAERTGAASSATERMVAGRAQAR